MLIVIASHPIQYQIPMWQRMTQLLGDQFMVIYLCKQGIENGRDDEFGRDIFWDFNLLDGYNFECIPGSPERVLGFWRNSVSDYRFLVAKFRQLKPRAVMINGWNLIGYLEAALLAKIFSPTELWLRCESNNYKKHTWFKHVCRVTILSIFLRFFSRFFYIGTANRKLYESFGIPPKKLTFAGYGVDNNKFSIKQLRKREKAKKRQKFGLCSDSKVVLFCGKLISKKRPVDLIYAAMQLNFLVKNIPLQLLFVGSGDLEPEINRLARQVNKHGCRHIVLAGFLNQSEITEAYSISDLMVLPSDASETWGLVVNEAQAAGLPTAVSSSCGSAVDLVEPLEQRLVFPEGDIAAIQNAITSGVFMPRGKFSQFSTTNSYSANAAAEAIAEAYG